MCTNKVNSVIFYSVYLLYCWPAGESEACEWRCPILSEESPWTTDTDTFFINCQMTTSFSGSSNCTRKTEKKSINQTHTLKERQEWSFTLQTTVSMNWHDNIYLCVCVSLPVASARILKMSSQHMLRSQLPEVCS